MKIGKFVGCATLGALVLSLIPYRFKADEETGTVEIRSLLWGFKKVPGGEGEDRDLCTFAVPASGLDEKEAPEAETPAEDPAE